MRITITILLLFSFSLAQGQRTILQDEWKQVHPQNITWAIGSDPFPEWRSQAFWAGLPVSLKTAYVEEAEKALAQAYPMLPASLFLEFARTGNRSNYQDAANKRRHMLQVLVLAECMERKGRFLDKIMDGIWAICEETYWGVPAHLYMQKQGYGLPDAAEPTVDLFTGETVALLAVTYHLLEKELNTVSPLIAQRILYEADRRVLTPNLTRRDFWWMSFDASLNNGTINNWNPWVNSNWLLAVLLLEKNVERKRQAFEKIVSSLDYFVNSYPEDGGCDEGPAYWGRAGGSLFDALELLYRATNGKFDVFDVPLVRNIGSYIYKANIRDRYFVNFADASAKVNISAGTVFLYGKRTANDTMMTIASQALRMQQYTEKAAPATGLFRNMLTFGVLPDMLAFDKPFRKAPFYFFPGTEVMVARTNLSNGKEMLLAAQGGHNAESHNHNDVGNFIVYYDGKPVLVDVGVETYTAKTFSKERYDIWTMQSQYHNVPTINGVQQKEGRKFAAKSVQAMPANGGARFSLDMAGAYPAEAAVRNWMRTLTLDPRTGITVNDEYELETIKGATVLHFMTPEQPVIESRQIIIRGQDFKLTLGYDGNLLEATADPVLLEDAQLRNSWGERLYRISLKVKSEKTRGKITMFLQPGS